MEPMRVVASRRQRRHLWICVYTGRIDRKRNANGESVFRPRGDTDDAVRRTAEHLLGNVTPNGSRRRSRLNSTRVHNGTELRRLGWANSVRGLRTLVSAAAATVTASVSTTRSGNSRTSSAQPALCGESTGNTPNNSSPHESACTRTGGARRFQAGRVPSTSSIPERCGARRLLGDS